MLNPQASSKHSNQSWNSDLRHLIFTFVSFLTCKAPSQILMTVTWFACRLPIIKVESLANNGSWVPLQRDSRLLGTFKAFRRSEMSLRV